MEIFYGVYHETVFRDGVLVDNRYRVGQEGEEPSGGDASLNSLEELATYIVDSAKGEEFRVYNYSSGESSLQSFGFNGSVSVYRPLERGDFDDLAMRISKISRDLGIVTKKKPFSGDRSHLTVIPGNGGDD